MNITFTDPKDGRTVGAELISSFAGHSNILIVQEAGKSTRLIPASTVKLWN